MAGFTIQKSTLNGESTIEILSPEIRPMVMHYNYNTGEYGPYMLEDYTGLTEGYCILGIRVTDYTGKVSETDTESGAVNV